MTDYTFWAGAAPPWEPTAHIDDAAIRTANAFYAVATTWYCNGAELRVPADSGMGTVTLSLRVGLNGVLPDLSTPPVASGQVDVGPDPGSYGVDWEGVEVFAPDAMWISLDSADGIRYLFVGGATVGPDFIKSPGIDLYMAESGHPRGAFRQAPGATASSQTWFGVSPKVSDTPPVPAEELPTTGTLEPVELPARTLIPLTPERDLVSLTPARTLEIP